MVDLSQVLTFSEAAQKWGFASGNTLRKAVERNKFNPDEIRKSGDTWLTTYEAMVRVFGQPRAIFKTIGLYELGNSVASSLYFHEDYDSEFQRILDSIREAIASKGAVMIVESEANPKVLSVIKTAEDLESFYKVMERYLSNFKNPYHKEKNNK